MAYESVKNQIDAYIKANGVNLITGPVLNAVLTTMLDELGEGYAFQGVLNTTDTPSPAADIPQAWLASAGTYLGGSITVDEGELALISHTSEGWSKTTVYTASPGIDGVRVAVDEGTGTPSATGEMDGNTLVLSFHNLKGETGPQGPKGDTGATGPQGPAGSDADVTAENITAALGYTPASSSALAGKQDTLVSGSNIKTVNGESILGSGNINVQKEEYVTVATLADRPTASASTLGKIYMVGPDANNQYDKYYTSFDGTAYSWVSAGTTEIDLTTYAKQTALDQLEAKETVLDNLRFEIQQKQNLLFELGNISIYNTGWTYSSSTTRVRTPEDFILHLYPGDIIGLTSYTDARFYWGCRDMSGKYTSGGWKTEDVVVAKEGYFCLLVCNLTDTTQTSAEALGSLINIRRNTNLGSVINTLKDISVGTISLYSAGHYYNDYGGDSSSANFNIYKATVKRGDYLCVTGNNSAGIAVFSRTATNGVANRVDAFMLGAGSGVPVRYICEKDEDIFISTAVNAPFEIVHIKDRQRNTLMDSERENFEDISNIVQYLQGYVKYSDGSFNTTSSPIYTAVFKAIGIKKVRVFVSSGDTLGAAIAFYSSETIGTASFISGVQIGRNNGGGRWYEATVPNNAVLITSTNHRTYCPTAIVKVDSASALIIDKAVDGSGVSTVKKIDAFAGNNPFRFNGPFYAHLFIDKIYETSTDITVPSESLDDIRVSRRLGFNVIEANVQVTSDGKLIVIHGSGGKFGYEVTDLNGEFTYADTAINSVTLDWIKANIRYRSDIPRFRTTVPTFEEFLRECRLQGIIPFAQASTADMVALLDGIMGYGNYFAYNGIRALTTAPIVEYLSLTTKEAILERARSIGVPYVYAMGNYNAFTDDELKDIVSSLHSEGFMIATAYVSGANADRVRKLGVDMIASTINVNNFDNANLCTLCVGTDWSDFQITGSSATDAGVELGEGDSITPANALGTEFLAKCTLQVTFVGKLGAICGRDSAELTSDGTHPLVLSSYVINSVPTFRIYGFADSATITDIVFKASKC